MGPARRRVRPWMLGVAGALAVASVVSTIVLAMRGDAADLFRRNAAGTCDRVLVSAPTTVLTPRQRSRVGLSRWPDTQPGVLRQFDGTYRFLSAEGGDRHHPPRAQVVTTGSRDATALQAAPTHIVGLPAGRYRYVGAGQLYRDPATGVILQTIHLERALAGSAARLYFTEIGLGRVDPASYQTTFLGVVLRSTLSFADAARSRYTVDLGTPSLVAPGDGYLYMYFGDFVSVGGRPHTTGLAAARTPLPAAIAAARRGVVSEWLKFDAGGWSAPGLGGASTDLEPGQPANWEPSAAYSPAMATTLVIAPVSPSEIRLSYLTASGWSQQRTLWRDPGRFDAYPVIVSQGGDPARPGRVFDVYYVQWRSASSRDWATAVQLRRTVACLPATA
jgi:hypothetical protein